MVFKPKYRVTNRVLNNLVKIAAAREAILNAPILPKWEIQLQKDALVQRVHHSTSIEGNKLTIGQVKKLLAGKDVAALDKDKKEVANYIKVLEYIDGVGGQKHPEISEKTILHIHKLTTRSLLEAPQCGRYRNRVVYVTNALGKIEYTPPKAGEVPDLVEAFIGWLDSDVMLKLDPILASGVAHHELVRIHPFLDGNGRTARALATLVLYVRGFDTKRFFALDDYYNEDRLAYYAALQKGSPGRKDLTTWLEYFTTGVAYSMGKVKESIQELSLDKRVKNAKGQIYLTQRQIWVVKHLQTNSRITIKEVQDKFRVVRSSANEILKPLRKDNIIARRGKGRATHYTLS